MNKNKFLFLNLITFISTCATVGNAATSGNCGTPSGSGTTENPYVYADTCTWKIEDGILTISGSGDMANMPYRGAP